MALKIPGDVLCFLIPAAIFFLWQFRYSNQRTGGGSFFPATSDRDGYWFFAAPAWLIVSLFTWAIYARFFL